MPANMLANQRPSLDNGTFYWHKCSISSNRYICNVHYNVIVKCLNWPYFYLSKLKYTQLSHFWGAIFFFSSCCGSFLLSSPVGTLPQCSESLSPSTGESCEFSSQMRQYIGRVLLPWKRDDWPASLAVIGCLCMEAILRDTDFPMHLIYRVISCVYKIFAFTHVKFSLWLFQI